MVLLLALISILLFAITGLALLQIFAPAEVIVDTTDNNKVPSGPTEAESFAIAQDSVLNSETYKYDGSKLEYIETITDKSSSCWSFTFRFESSHAGYGDRTNKVLAQVITSHEAIIMVENGIVTSAILDEDWDILKQERIQNDESNNSSHIVIDVDDTEISVAGCESSLITCGCHAKGTSPESSGLLGGINCYGLYGLTGCEEIDGVCFAIYENPGLEVNKSVYAMSETVNITYKPPKGTFGPSYDCKEAWKVERYINGNWVKLQTNKFDNYFECKESGPKAKTNSCDAETIAYTKVYRASWNLYYWLEEPQMCNGEIFTGIRQVNSGPGHYRITWNDSSAEFQITS